jgi:hypothetical protein
MVGGVVRGALCEVVDGAAASAPASNGRGVYCGVVSMTMVVTCHHNGAIWP